MKVHDSPSGDCTMKLFLKKHWSLFNLTEVPYFNGTITSSFSFMPEFAINPDILLILVEWLVTVWICAVCLPKKLPTFLVTMIMLLSRYITQLLMTSLSWLKIWTVYSRTNSVLGVMIPSGSCNMLSSSLILKLFRILLSFSLLLLLTSSNC